MLEMPSPGTVTLLGLVVLYGIVHFGAKSWAESVEGFAKGNRYRFVAVIKMEIFMVFLNVFVYRQLMQWFTAEEKSKAEPIYRRKLKQRVSLSLIVFLFLSHMIYFMYYAPQLVQWLLFDLMTIVCGVWTNVLAFVCGFFLVNVLIGPFNAFAPTRCFIAQFARIPYLRGLIYDRKEQIKFTIGFSLVLSFLMWYACDKVVVKHRDFSISNYTGERPLRFAVVSDIHAGASVYRGQVDRVVDKLLPLNVDAVLIVGDMVDGEVKDIADRIRSIWMVAERFPTFFVTGNHDYYYGNVEEWLNLYESHGIRVLTNTAVMFKGICLAGASDIASHKAGVPNQEINITAALSYCPPKSEASRVLMAHNPVSVREISEEDLPTLDLVLSGHTHAGQFYVVIPVVYWLLPYFYGVYDLPAPSHGKLMVSAGSLYQGPPMKMFWMSEIWVVTLKSS